MAVFWQIAKTLPFLEGIRFECRSFDGSEAELRASLASGDEQSNEDRELSLPVYTCGV
jgi:hypothetical protein